MTQLPKVEISSPPAQFDLTCETLIIGAGACGLVAALTASEAGQEVLVVEADPVPRGSTALSAGLIPAAGTRFQRVAGIEDSAEAFARDIQAKAQGENEQALVDTLAQNAGPVIDWLAQTHGLNFSVVTDFRYPGHSAHRMHGLPTRSGMELIDALRGACEARGIDIVCNRRAISLYRDGLRMRGAAVRVADGREETIGSRRVILACNGFGGNRDLVAELTPDIKDAVWFGHDGNRGEAILWGRELGADMRALGAYQGHGNVAHPQGILITWATMTEGGFQVNREGKRFWNEAQGYSEAARAVLSQSGGLAYAIFDARIAAIAAQFEDFKNAQAIGAVKTGETIEDLGDRLGIPSQALAQTLMDLPTEGRDEFGRTFTGDRLTPPFHGVQVTGALFHTQGGLRTDGRARVLDLKEEPIEGLYAGGGAACGVSGQGDVGYLSGNGLLSAVVLGRLAGLASTPPRSLSRPE